MKKLHIEQLAAAIIGVLFCATALFVALPSTAAAAKNVDYAYTVSNGEATITDYAGSGGAIAIPSKLGGYPVVAIGGGAFAGKTSVTSVTIPDSVTFIDWYAFQGCGLTSLTIPSSVTSIGKSAFYSCPALTSVTLGGGTLSLDDGVFQHCTALTSVTIGSGVTAILYHAFDHCTSLTSVVIPSSVTAIEGGAFWECTALTSITFQGLTAPWVDDFGGDWIGGTPAEIRGHAYAASDFPPPGGVWNGLTMGDHIVPPDIAAPTISGYINGARLSQSSNDVITVQVWDGEGGVDWSSLKVLVDKKPFEEYSLNLADFMIYVNDMSPGKHTIKVTVSDMAGNTAIASWSVQVLPL